MKKKLDFIPNRFLISTVCFALVIGFLKGETLKFPYQLNLKTGDLIFQCEGNSDFSAAIANSTSDDLDSLKFVHVGIIELANDSAKVIEASPEEGVRIISLEDFLKLSPVRDGQPAVVLKRLDMEFPVEEAIARAKSHLGESYDWCYLPDNGKMYCSELVFESYLDWEGNKIFQAQPMNFRNSDGSIPEFWLNLFQELGQPVPEGIPGTNPNDLSKQPALKEIDK